MRSIQVWLLYGAVYILVMTPILILAHMADYTITSWHIVAIAFACAIITDPDTWKGFKDGE